MGYLDHAKNYLRKMRTKYDSEKKNLTVRERSKRRNCISALESRIKKKQDADGMQKRLQSHMKRVGELASLVDQIFGDDEKAQILIDLKEDPTKRKFIGKPYVTHAICRYFERNM